MVLSLTFATGTITESDGITPLGNNFTPPTIPLSEYHWFGISLLPGALNAVSQQLATVQVDIADSSNAVHRRRGYSGYFWNNQIRLGTSSNNAGSIERVDINRLGVGSGSGSGGSGGKC